MPAEGDELVDLAQYPVLNKYGAVYEFTVPFNTRCGDDQVSNFSKLMNMFI